MINEGMGPTVYLILNMLVIQFNGFDAATYK